MGLSRKEFICSAALAAGSHAVFARPEARPLMRLGMIADVHLETGETGKAVQNCLCFEPALRYLIAYGNLDSAKNYEELIMNHTLFPFYYSFASSLSTILPTIFLNCSVSGR